MPSACLNTTPREGRSAGLDWLFLATMLLACAVALSKNNADPDFWGHVRYGRDLLAHGLPPGNTYSYTAPGYRWINHENLSELAFALGVDWIGPRGLLAGKCFLGLAMLALMIWRAHRAGVSQTAVFLTALLVSVNLMHFWSLRPQLFSFCLFTWLVLQLTWCFESAEGRWNLPWWNQSVAEGEGVAAATPGRLAWLWLIPPVFVVWANTHGGFLAGYFVLLTYLACRSVESLAMQGRRAVPQVAHHALLAVVTGGATLLNPYGSELHQWLFTSLGEPRPEIVEWRPPELLHIAWLPFWMLVAVFGMALWSSNKSRDFTHIVLLALTLWQAVEHRRHIAFFAILFGFWMPAHVHSLLSRLGIGRDSRSLSASFPARTRVVVAAVLCAACLFISRNLVTQLRQLPVRRDGYPVSAFQYIADEQLQGRLVTRFKWAQYAISAFAPHSGRNEGLLVAFDGRFRTCYPQQIVDMYFDFAVGDAGAGQRYRDPASPPIDDTRLLEYGRPDLVLIDRNQAHPCAVMRRNQDRWVLLYQDQLAQLWGRAARFGNPLSPDYLPADRRKITSQPQSGVVAWPAHPVRRGDAAHLAQHR